MTATNDNVTNRAVPIGVTITLRVGHALSAEILRLLAAGSLMCALAQLGDLVPVASSNVSLGADPGTADSVDEGSVDEFLDVVIVDTAGGRNFMEPKGAARFFRAFRPP